jgi:hypothetical protein
MWAVTCGAGVVGLPGLEPGTSSLSAITRLPLCNPAFLQVVLDRRGRSNALSDARSFMDALAFS